MANWQWFHRLGSPKWLLATLDRWLPWLLSLGLLMLVGALVWGLAFVPPDYKQGNSFRIMYIHVPTAVVALAAYYAMAIAGAVAMIWRMKVAENRRGRQLAVVLWVNTWPCPTAELQ